MYQNLIRSNSVCEENVHKHSDIRISCIRSSTHTVDRLPVWQYSDTRGIDAIQGGSAPAPISNQKCVGSISGEEEWLQR